MATRMKSDKVRTNWAEVLRRVEAGESVIIEHYNRAVAILGPVHAGVIDSMSGDPAMLSDDELLRTQLAYLPEGGNHHLDPEVWQRWPELKAIRSRYELAIQTAALNRGPVDILDMSTTPEMDEAHADYLREYHEAAQRILDQAR